MSSSDSDDDCYGNVAKKLQSLKNKYIHEKAVISLSELSIDAQNSESKIDKYTAEDGNEIVKYTAEDGNTTLNSTDNEEFTLDAIIAKNTKSKPGRKRKSDEETFEPVYERETRSSKRLTRGRGKRGRGSATTDNLDTPVNTNETSFGFVSEELPAPSRRGRRGRNAAPTIESDSFQVRGRGTPRGASRRTSRSTTPSRARGIGRNTRHNSFVTAYPIYSIGNTDEYPDMCESQELFSTNTNTKDVEIIEDNDPLETDNEELSVKVYWQNIDVIRFNLRKYQKLTPVFKYFSEKENVAVDKLLFMYNDRILKADDTPDSIKYSIAKFIDGGIVNQDISNLVKCDTDEGKGIKIKFQCQILKKPYEVKVKPEDKLISAMLKFAEHIDIPLERLRFYFDGDLFSNQLTPEELELEGGECIDVKIIS